MPRLEAGWISVVLGVLAALGLFYLIVPIVMIFPLSVDPSPMLRFPPQDFSLTWYKEYLSDAGWIESTFISLRIATIASIIATVVGTSAAIAMHRHRIPGHAILSILLIMPMMLPLVVVAIAIYGVYARLGLVGTELGIALAHSVLAMPFVVLNVNAALAALPKSYEEAALSLGATHATSIRLVTVPLIWRGIAAGGVFAFVISFDEVVIAMFLSSISSTTLPKRMLDGIFFDLSPILAAVSAVLVLFNIALAVIGLALANASKRAMA